MNRTCVIGSNDAKPDCCANNTRGPSDRSGCDRPPCQSRSPQALDRFKQATVFVPATQGRVLIPVQAGIHASGYQTGSLQTMRRSLRIHAYTVAEDITHYERNLQQIDAVSSPSVCQTPEPSLLFPSIIAAFLTGSKTKGLGRGTQLRAWRICTKVRVTLCLTSG